MSDAPGSCRGAFFFAKEAPIAEHTLTTADGKRLHETKAPTERAYLVGAELTGGRSAWRAEDSLQELALLCDTAGLEVVGSTYQRLKQPYPKHFIGPGKVEEIAHLRDELKYDVLVFDDELTPAQSRNIEEVVQKRVIDRTTLILDIFAKHARTREGRVQVELAQYKYLLPRLRRAWTHLERQAGGGGGSAGGVVGLRGPGETQLEVDRRLVGQRIAWLEQQIDDLHRQRELHRIRRRKTGVPVVALVGYTNAGKSTLLNALAGADVRAEDRLFATLDPTIRQVGLPGGQQMLLTDTVGFIQKLPTQLVAAFRTTLEEIREADLLLHVLDINHPNALQQAETVRATLHDLKADDRPVLTVMNKADLLGGLESPDVAARAAELALPPDAMPVSAAAGLGMAALLARIERTLSLDMDRVQAFIPYRRNDLLAVWHQRGVVEEERYEAEGTFVAGKLPPLVADQFEPFLLGEDAAGETNGVNGKH